MNLNHEKIAEIDEKLEELIGLLADCEINNDAANYFKQQFDHAIKIANKDHKHEAEPQNHAFSTPITTKQSYKYKLERYLRGERLSNIIFIVIGVVMIVMGFGMIIMPAPPFFEMFTIYYFNRTDGITIMDLISLLIILAGIYFLIKGLYPNPDRKKAVTPGRKRFNKFI